MRRTAGVVLQLAGLAAVTAGVCLLAVWAGVIVGGAAAFTVGVKLEAEGSR